MPASTNGTARDLRPTVVCSFSAPANQSVFPPPSIHEPLPSMAVVRVSCQPTDPPAIVAPPAGSDAIPANAFSVVARLHPCAGEGSCADAVAANASDTAAMPQPRKMLEFMSPPSPQEVPAYEA